MACCPTDSSSALLRECFRQLKQVMQTGYSRKDHSIRIHSQGSDIFRCISKERPKPKIGAVATNFDGSEELGVCLEPLQHSLSYP